jgi:hypothetical protein
VSNEPIEMEECAACGEMTPVDDGESIVTHTHRIEGRAVAHDHEFVCNRCIEQAEEWQTERALESRRWRRYSQWEHLADGGSRNAIC